MTKQFSPVNLAELARMKGSHARIVLTLHAFADAGGICWPSLSTIAKFARMTVGQVSRALREMESLGYLAISRRGRGKCYQLARRLVLAVVGNAVGKVGRAIERGTQFGKSTLTKMSPERIPLKDSRNKDGGRSLARSARPGHDGERARLGWLGKLGEYCAAVKREHLGAFWEAAMQAQCKATTPARVQALLDRLDDEMRGSYWYRERMVNAG